MGWNWGDVIQNTKYEIRYTKYVIRNTLYVIRYTLYDIRYTKYDIQNISIYQPGKSAPRAACWGAAAAGTLLVLTIVCTLLVFY